MMYGLTKPVEDVAIDHSHAARVRVSCPRLQQQLLIFFSRVVLF